MGVAQPETSPYFQEFEDYIGRKSRITITFDETTRILSTITLFCDEGCLFPLIAVGLGPDGTPDTSTRMFDCPEGTKELDAAEMDAVRANGMNTIEAFASYQITACHR
jgi:hypothetical protein